MITLGIRGKLNDSKAGDFWYAHGDKVKMILQILVMIGSVLVMVGLVLGWFVPADEKREEEKLLNRDFGEDYELLSERDLPTLGKYGKSMSILIKDPFMSRYDLEVLVEYLVETEKERLKESDLEEEIGQKLHAMEIKIYHRRVVYEEDLEPRGIVFYQHKDGWIASFEKGIGKFKKYKNHEYDITYKLMEEQFRKTEEELVGMDVDDDEKVSTYLNDEEYEMFMEILLYSVLRGRADLLDGVYPYIVKNYGLTKDKHTEEYFKKEQILKERMMESKRYGEPSDLYGDNAEYLLEYYKVAEPEIYEFIHDF